MIVGPLNGGSLDRVHVEAGVPVFSHFFHDLVPYWDCCLLSANCGKYFEKRPSDDGSRYIPVRPATTYGDPHIVTLDGMEYTFNGFGEYHILKVADLEFELQGRMQPLIDENGETARATIYTAFAMRENSSDVVQVYITGRNEAQVLVNGFTTEFNESMMDFNGVRILKCRHTSIYTVIFNSGISVFIEKADDILEIMLQVPSTWKGKTSGLMGSWDDNKEFELLLPNGTFLSTNSSQARIHYEFGQNWATSANESLFTYDEGKNHASHFDSDYKPVFLDEEDLVFKNATLGQQAHSVCGDSKQCLFDIYTTGKVSIGRASKKARESYTVVINQTETVDVRDSGVWFLYLTSCEAVPFVIALVVIVVTCIVISKRGRKFLRGHQQPVSQVGRSSKDEPTNESSSDASVNTPGLETNSEQRNEELVETGS